MFPTACGKKACNVAAADRLYSDYLVALDSPRRDLVILVAAQPGSPDGTWPQRTTQGMTTLVEEAAWGWQLPATMQAAGASLPRYAEQRIDPSAALASADAGSGSASSAATPLPPTPRRRGGHR